MIEKPFPNPPLVSVIIPAFNAEAFLARTLASVLNQSYGNIEVIVVDDGSDDQTCQIVEAIAVHDSRVTLFKQANGGVASARNAGIQIAKGQFIAPIDADDIWYPEAIEKMMAPFQTQGPDLGVVYAWSLDIDEVDQATGGFHAAQVAGNVFRVLICHNFLGNASSTIIRRSCLDNIGGYDVNLKAQNAQGCEDWDLYIRLAEQYKFQGVPEFLVGYRNMTGSMSGDFAQMARSQNLMLKSIQEKHPNLPGFLYRLSQSSYYLYLAHQCDASQQASQTLNWLKQAIHVDPITPIGRLGFYRLLFKSIYQLIRKRQLSPRKTETTQVRSKPLSSSTVAQPPKQPEKLPISRFQVWLKIFVGYCLHQSLSII